MKSIRLDNLGRPLFSPSMVATENSDRFPFVRHLYTHYVLPLLQVESPERISLLDRSSLLFLAFATFWYVDSYAHCGMVPGNQEDGYAGWWVWFDQREYYQTTINLAHGQLKPSRYWFGYPMLGVPFYWLMPRQPYFIPDLVLVLVFVGGFFASCRHVVGRIEAWLIVCAFVFFDPFMWGSTLIPPWNSIPAYAALSLSAYLLIFGNPTLRQFAGCALLGGLALAARPTEIFALGTLYLFAAMALPSWKSRLTAAGYFAAVAVAVAGATVGLNLYFYGEPGSPYTHLEAPKFHADYYGLKVYQFLSDGTFLTGRILVSSSHTTASLIEVFPGFLFCLPGVIWLASKYGLRALGLPLAIAATVGFYLTYTTNQSMSYFWVFNSYRYFWWSIPWLVLLSWLTFRQAFFHLSRPVFIAALLVPLLAFLAIGFKAVPIAGTEGGTEQLGQLTSYARRTYTLELIAPRKLDALDLALDFQQTPSYSGTSNDSAQLVQVWVNDRRLDFMPDYFMSQDGSTFHFNFLMHGLTLQPGDHLRIVFPQTDEPVLRRATLFDAAFHWGRFRKGAAGT